MFKLFDVDSNENLKQDQWIESIKGRMMWVKKSQKDYLITFNVIICFLKYSDEKQIDFAEQLESVAYVICGENTVTFDKFVQIWNAKGVSNCKEKICCTVKNIFFFAQRIL